MHNTCPMNKDVEPIGEIADPLGEVMDLGLDREVRPKKCSSVSPRLLSDALDRSCSCGFVAANEQDAHAVLCEPYSSLKAESACAACNQCCVLDICNVWYQGNVLLFVIGAMTGMFSSP
jgi:hypothetical protein